MANPSGLLSKTSNSQYRLLTMDGEFLINGNLSLHDGFHSNLDLSTFIVTQIEANQLVSSGTFSTRHFKNVHNSMNDCDCQSDCECSDCACGDFAGDFSITDECESDC